MNKSRSIHGIHQNMVNSEDSDDSINTVERRRRAYKLLNLEKELVRPTFFQDTEEFVIPHLRRSIVTRAYQDFKSSTPFQRRQTHLQFFPSERSSGSISPVVLTDSENEKTYTDDKNKIRDDEYVPKRQDCDIENVSKLKSLSQGNFFTGAKLNLTSTNPPPSRAQDVTDFVKNCSKISKSQLNKCDDNKCNNTANSVKEYTEVLPEKSKGNSKQHLSVDEPIIRNEVAADNSNHAETKTMENAEAIINKSFNKIMPRVKLKQITKKKIVKKAKVKSMQRKKLLHKQKEPVVTVNHELSDSEGETESNKQPDIELCPNIPNLNNLDIIIGNQQIDKSIPQKDKSVQKIVEKDNQKDINKSVRSNSSYVQNCEPSSSSHLSEQQNQYNQETINKSTQQDVNKSCKNGVNEIVQRNSNFLVDLQSSALGSYKQQDKNSQHVTKRSRRNNEHKSLKRNSEFIENLEPSNENLLKHRDKSHRKIINRSMQVDIEKSREKDVDNSEKRNNTFMGQDKINQENANRSTQNDGEEIIQNNSIRRSSVVANNIIKQIFANNSSGKNRNDLKNNLTHLNVGIEYDFVSSDEEINPKHNSSVFFNKRRSKVSPANIGNEKSKKQQRLDSIVSNISSMKNNSNCQSDKSGTGVPKSKNLRNLKSLVDKEIQTSLKKIPDQSEQSEQSLTVSKEKDVETNKENGEFTDLSNSSCNSQILRNLDKDVLYNTLPPGQPWNFFNESSYPNVSHAEGPWRPDDAISQILSNNNPNRLSTKLNFLKTVSEIEASKSKYLDSTNIELCPTRPSISQVSLNRLNDRKLCKSYSRKEVPRKIDSSNQNNSDEDDTINEDIQSNSFQKIIDDNNVDWSEDSNDSVSGNKNKKQSEHRANKKEKENETTKKLSKKKTIERTNKCAIENESEVSSDSDSELEFNNYLHKNLVYASKCKNCKSHKDSEKHRQLNCSAETSRINEDVANLTEEDLGNNENRNQSRQQIDLSKQKSIAKSPVVQNHQISRTIYNQNAHQSTDTSLGNESDPANSNTNASNQEIRKSQENLNNTPKSCQENLTQGILFKEILSMDLESAAKEKIINLLLSNEKGNYSRSNINNSIAEIISNKTSDLNNLHPEVTENVLMHKLKERKSRSEIEKEISHIKLRSLRSINQNNNNVNFNATLQSSSEENLKEIKDQNPTKTTTPKKSPIKISSKSTKDIDIIDSNNEELEIPNTIIEKNITPEKVHNAPITTPRKYITRKSNKSNADPGKTNIIYDEELQVADFVIEENDIPEKVYNSPRKSTNRMSNNNNTAPREVNIIASNDEEVTNAIVEVITPENIRESPNVTTRKSTDRKSNKSNSGLKVVNVVVNNKEEELGNANIIIEENITPEIVTESKMITRSTARKSIKNNTGLKEANTIVSVNDEELGAANTNNITPKNVNKPPNIIITKCTNQKSNKNTTLRKADKIISDSDEELVIVNAIVENVTPKNVNKSLTMTTRSGTDRKSHNSNAGLQETNVVVSDNEEELEVANLITEENISPDVKSLRKSTNKKSNITNVKLSQRKIGNEEANIPEDGNGVNANSIGPVAIESVSKKSIANSSLSGRRKNKTKIEVSTESDSEKEAKATPKKKTSRTKTNKRKNSKAGSSQMNASSSTTDDDKAVFKVPKMSKVYKKRNESMSSDSTTCRRSGRERKPAAPRHNAGYLICHSEKILKFCVRSNVSSDIIESNSKIPKTSKSRSKHSGTISSVSKSSNSPSVKGLSVSLERISMNENSTMLKKHLIPDDKKSKPVARKLTFSSDSTTTMPDSYCYNTVSDFPDSSQSNSVNMKNVSHSLSGDKYLRSVKSPSRVEKKTNKINNKSKALSKIISKNQRNSSEDTIVENILEDIIPTGAEKRNTRSTLLQTQVVQNDTSSILFNEELVSIKYVHNDSIFKYVKSDNVWVTNVVDNINGMKMMLLKIPSRNRTSLKRSKHPWMYCVIEGEGRVQVQNNYSNIGPMSQIAIPTGALYSIINTHPSRFLILSCVKSLS